MRAVFLCDLGICEHCGGFVTNSSSSPVNKKGLVICSHCKGRIKNSFGFSPDGKRVRWVGPEGKWVRHKPESNFFLKNMNVIVA
jgi:hypothetical protein